MPPTTSQAGLRLLATQVGTALPATTVSITDTIARFQTNVAAAPGNPSVRTAPMAAHVDRHTQYVLDAGATDFEKDCWLWYLILCSHGITETSSLVWGNWIATLAGALFGGLLNTEENTTVVEIPVPGDTKGVIVGIISSLCDLRAPMAPNAVADLTRLDATLPEFMLPPAQYPEEPKLISGVEKSMWFAYFGVIMFAVVKDVGGSGRNALLTNRFKALRAKYKWSDVQAPMLSDILRPTDVGFQRINTAWTRIPNIRRILFTAAIKISETTSRVEEEALFTTIRLMKYADMSHVAIILRFLSIYGWAARLQELRADCDKFSQALTIMDLHCPIIYATDGKIRRDANGEAVRDRTILPYLKMIHGDKLDIARRDSVEVLLYVAHQVLARDDNSLNQYNVTKTYAGALAAFDMVRTLAQDLDHDDSSSESSVAADE